MTIECALPPSPLVFLAGAILGSALTFGACWWLQGVKMGKTWRGK